MLMIFEGKGRGLLFIFRRLLVVVFFRDTPFCRSFFAGALHFQGRSRIWTIMVKVCMHCMAAGTKLHVMMDRRTYP